MERIVRRCHNHGRAVGSVPIGGRQAAESTARVRSSGGDEGAIQREGRAVVRAIVEDVVLPVGRVDQKHEAVSLLGSSEASAGRQSVPFNELVGIAREELEVGSLAGGGGRAATLKGDGRGSGGRVDRVARGGFGVQRGADCAETVVVGRVELADGVTIKIHKSTGELNAIIALSGGGGLHGGEIFRLAFQREKTFTGGNHHVAVDFVLVDRGNRGRTRAASAELLAGGDDTIIADNVGGAQGVHAGLVVGIDVIFAPAFVQEHFHQLFGFDAAEPVAKHHRDVGLQLGSQCRLFLEPAVVGNRMPKKVNGQVVRANAEIFRVVVDQRVAGDALSVELGHRAERDLGSSTATQVAEGHDRVALSRPLELVEEVLSGLGELYPFLPKLGKKRGRLTGEVSRRIVGRDI